MSALVALVIGLIVLVLAIKLVVGIFGIIIGLALAIGAYFIAEKLVGKAR